MWLACGWMPMWLAAYVAIVGWLGGQVWGCLYGQLLSGWLVRQVGVWLLSAVVGYYGFVAVASWHSGQSFGWIIIYRYEVDQLCGWVVSRMVGCYWRYFGYIIWRRYLVIQDVYMAICIIG